MEIHYCMIKRIAQ